MLKKIYGIITQIIVLILLTILINPITLVISYPLKLVCTGGEECLIALFAITYLVYMIIISLSFYILFVDKDKIVLKETIKSALKTIFPFLFLLSVLISFLVTKPFYFNIIVIPFLLIGSLIISFLYFIPLYKSQEGFGKNILHLFLLGIMFAIPILLSPFFMSLAGEAWMIAGVIWGLSIYFFMGFFILGCLLALLQQIILHHSTWIKYIFIVLIIMLAISGIYGYTQNKTYQDWTEMAIQENDITLCSKIEYNPEDCQLAFAVAKSNSDICNLITKTEIKDVCYKELASKLNDPALCENILLEGYKIHCNAVAINNPELCYSVPGLPGGYDGSEAACFRDLAIKSLDHTLCENIPQEDSSYTYHCYNTIAIETKNPELCNKIPSLFTRGIELCLEESN